MSVGDVHEPIGSSWRGYSIFGFGLDFAEGAYVSMKKGSSWQEGESKLEALEGGVPYVPLALIKLTIVWKPLSQVSFKFGSPASVASATVKKAGSLRHVGKLDVLESRPIEISDHVGWFLHMKAFKKRTLPLFDKSVVSRSVHLFCSTSDRYFVFQSSIQPRLDKYHGLVFEHAAKSLRCHELKPYQPTP
jgi:hypothetical protein